MSHTNSTTNYHLPQFVGTDKPAWLVDFNSAMSDIDTAVKNASDTATTAGTKATANEGAIGTLASLNTTTKSDLVSAVNEVNTAVGTAQSTANSASADASSALTTAGQTQTKLNNAFTFTTQVVSCTASGYTLPSGSNSLTVAKNVDGSIAKIYGRIRLTPSNTTANLVSGDTGLRPDTAITINCCCLRIAKLSGTGNQVYLQDFVINVDGTVTASIANSTAFTEGEDIIFLATTIYVKNFGDTPMPE